MGLNHPDGNTWGFPGIYSSVQRGQQEASPALQAPHPPQNLSAVALSPPCSRAPRHWLSLISLQMVPASTLLNYHFLTS